MNWFSKFEWIHTEKIQIYHFMQISSWLHAGKLFLWHTYLPQVGLFSQQSQPPLIFIFPEYHNLKARVQILTMSVDAWPRCHSNRTRQVCDRYFHLRSAHQNLVRLLNLKGPTRWNEPSRLKLIYGSSQHKMYTIITQTSSLHINEVNGCNEYVIQTFFRRKSSKIYAICHERLRPNLKREGIANLVRDR